MRVPHPHRPLLRPGPCPPRTKRPGPGLPPPPSSPALPARRPPVLRQRHGRDDPLLGEPLCPDCYDYTGTVLFNACAPELWRRFTITLRRALARQAGITAKALAAQIRVSYAKVAEYQRRGVVHFHAIIRLDGPAGPATAPPAWATLDLLTAAIAQAARAVRIDTPAAAGLPARTLAWGTRARHPAHHHDRRTDRHQCRLLRRQVRHQGRRMHRHPRPPHHPGRPLAALPVREHARRLIAECLRLGKLPELEDLRLAAWAHMLGFSRPLRDQEPPLLHHPRRAPRRTRRTPARATPSPPGSGPTPDGDTVLVRPDWNFTGRGHPPIPAATGRRTGGEVTTLDVTLFTIDEAAARLRVSRWSVYNLIRSGQLRTIKIGRRRLVPIDASMNASNA